MHTPKNPIPNQAQNKAMPSMRRPGPNSEAMQEVSQEADRLKVTESRQYSRNTKWLWGAV